MFFYRNRILGPITSDVINIVTPSTWTYAPYTRNQITTRQDWKTFKISSLHCVKMYPDVLLIYGILVRKYKNVTITLQKERENPLKIRFCFQTADKIVIYVSTHGHWDCTTLQHHCTTFSFASGYAEVFQGGTISRPMGRYVDNLLLYFTLETRWKIITIFSVREKK
jgi:hypothetical protein